MIRFKPQRDLICGFESSGSGLNVEEARDQTIKVITHPVNLNNLSIADNEKDLWTSPQKWDNSTTTLYKGMLVYVRDTGIIYVLENADKWKRPESWKEYKGEDNEDLLRVHKLDLLLK